MFNLKAKLIGQGTRSLICTPLVGQSKEKILGELEQALNKQPDVIEWRADFFEGIGNTDDVVDVAEQIKAKIGDMPVIFTIRSIREGGYPITLTEPESVAITAAVCRRTAVEYVDCELSNDPELIKGLREIANETGTRIIGSFHNFQMTPSREVILEKFAKAEQYELDVAKVAVMPQGLEDVLTLLSATLEGKKRYRLPLITMSMGRNGALSRIAGGLFGSSLTFAIGAESSAPGQIPIDDLKTALTIIEQAMESK